MPPKVLIVEDDRVIHQGYRMTLKESVEILKAETVAEGWALFERYAHEIAVIVLDACVPRHKGAGVHATPTTYELAERIRKYFHGPIIAASSEDFFRMELVRRGCSHHCPKGEVPATILKCIGAVSPP